MTDCPCGSGRPLDQCCGPVIAGTPAATPEALMRARYTAFLQGAAGFLETSLAPEKRAEMDRREVERSAREATGHGLEVLSASDGENGVATVEYVARFTLRGRPVTHHELASFRREDDGWLYVDGRVNPGVVQRQAAKVGRNDPCPCGSGQKYKKCCGG